MVDDNNNNRHDSPSLEETWGTHRWPIRVFSFLLALSEVNTFLAFRYFVWTDPTKKNPTFHKFRKAFVKQLIFNPFRNKEVSPREDDNPSFTSLMMVTRKRSCENVHKLLTAPKHAKKWTLRDEWDLNSAAKYQQFTCYGCRSTRIRTYYCSCNPAKWRCKNCYAMHVKEDSKQKNSPSLTDDLTPGSVFLQISRENS